MSEFIVKRIILAVLAVNLASSPALAESFNVTFHGNHQVTVGTDDFDGSMVRTILKIRDEKVNLSKPEQYINEIGYVCSPSVSKGNSVHVRTYYTTSRYVYGRQIGGTLGSTRSYDPIKVKFDNDSNVIEVPLVKKSPSDLWSELDLLEPSLVNKMKVSSVMRVKDGLGGSAKFDMTGSTSAFDTFFKYCR
ncbi:hypothetical protein QNE54_001089 [Vibrio fluvialis]|nr:hypothetical protein [Vibrio fluvialis]